MTTRRPNPLLLVVLTIAVARRRLQRRAAARSAPCRRSSGSPEPSVAQGSPDVTPAPSADESSAPTDEPSEEPTDTGRARRARPPTPSGTTIVRAYFWLGGGPGSAGLVATLREVPGTKAVATAAVNALLAGPTAGESAPPISTAVPDGTQLLGLTIEGGVATVNLSSEFASGGDADAVQTRHRPGRLHADPVPVGQVGRRPGRGRRRRRRASGRADFVALLPDDLGRPARVERRDRQPGPRHRLGRRLRGDVPDLDPRRVRQGHRRPAGDGDVRQRLPRDVRHDGRLHRLARPVRDAPRLRPVREGRLAAVDPRLPGLAHAEGLTRSSSTELRRPGRSGRGAAAFARADRASGVLDRDPLDDVRDVLGLVDRLLEEAVDVLPLDRRRSGPAACWNRPAIAARAIRSPSFSRRWTSIQ